ncbi:TetR/AcrR family transcriptional regulator [Aurantiacibacter sp. D1-12]|uniref:TetR/AcrR family transcriptional regulator n=1 Tax=Aurantiacibacter sp. D1-12 TaxID=2993658 RepID=UPI00237CDA3F|nr:TetR/AcrR family transcriptional regulator [Aurantiacibacter sp. D1-12]MDE1467080.1 helix-turn-helix domain containing protein [Aurantiacibacter sp. D1-12]
MPYSKDHKASVRSKIVEAARQLFNRYGFDNVSIDQLMAEAGLTRGGFYAHFRSKEEVFAAATASFLSGRGAQWRSEAGVDPSAGQREMAKRMVASYLSREHLEAVDAQCPLIAYATDVARSGPQVRESYRDLLQAMVGLYEANLGETDKAARRRALSLAALTIGGMVVARALPGEPIANEIREAALADANALWLDCEPAHAIA